MLLLFVAFTALGLGDASGEDVASGEGEVGDGDASGDVEFPVEFPPGEGDGTSAPVIRRQHATRNTGEGRMIASVFGQIEASS